MTVDGTIIEQNRLILQKNLCLQSSGSQHYVRTKLQQGTLHSELVVVTNEKHQRLMNSPQKSAVVFLFFLSLTNAWGEGWCLFCLRFFVEYICTTEASYKVRRLTVIVELSKRK